MDVDEAMFAALSETAREAGRDESEVILEALREYLARLNPGVDDRERVSRERIARAAAFRAAAGDGLAASAGSWADFDADAFLAANYASRDISYRPAPEL